MNYPLIENDDSYTKEPVCPICKKKKVFEPHDFLVLSGGAFLLNENGDSVFNANLKGFLDLCWHTHNESGKCIQIKVVNDSTNGQFGLYFCSIECFRTFINEVLGDLERKMNDRL